MDTRLQFEQRALQSAWTDEEANMGTRTLAAILIAVSSAACGEATQLSPAPGAPVAPVGPGEGTVASENDVLVEVRTQAWSADPVTLDSEITPLFVRITNNSKRPLLVRHRAVALVQGGVAYAAIPPHDIDDTVRENYVYPDYGYYWAGWSAYRNIELPTNDMVQLALPEGALEPGKTIEGFLYFEDLDDDDADVMFSMPLVDASSRSAFGNVEIQFIAY
jgi:hypothetical protein